MADEQAEPDQQASRRPDRRNRRRRRRARRRRSCRRPRLLPARFHPARSRGACSAARNDRVLAGVAGGIGAYLGIDPVLVRIGFVLATILGAGLGILL